jgi:uracil-DNA glycosylase
MSLLVDNFPKSWSDYANLELLNQIDSKIDWEKKIYPNKSNIFKALHATAPESVKVVILGQDPYHGENQAMGLSFSVPALQKIPPSLKNIFKEIERSTGSLCLSGDLTPWSKQGVLLINSILTVCEKDPGSHKNTGWLTFTEQLLHTLTLKKTNLVFLCWGSFAQKLVHKFNAFNGHLFLKSPHPSPLSAHRGFLGCDHFVKCNQFLKLKGKDPVNWSTPFAVENKV